MQMRTQMQMQMQMQTQMQLISQSIIQHPIGDYLVIIFAEADVNILVGPFHVNAVIFGKDPASDVDTYVAEDVEAVRNAEGIVVVQPHPDLGAEEISVFDPERIKAGRSVENPDVLYVGDIKGRKFKGNYVLT